LKNVITVSCDFLFGKKAWLLVNISVCECMWLCLLVHVSVPHWLACYALLSCGPQVYTVSSISTVAAVSSVSAVSSLPCWEPYGGNGSLDILKLWEEGFLHTTNVRQITDLDPSLPLLSQRVLFFLPLTVWLRQRKDSEKTCWDHEVLHMNCLWTWGVPRSLPSSHRRVGGTAANQRRTYLKRRV